MSKLLINEPPLQVLPSLAIAVGLNEAMFLQQLHYWIANPKVGTEHEGRKWIRNSLVEWQEQFPFWSIDTIKRTIKSLKDRGIVLWTTDLNKMSIDRTVWYSLDYEALDSHRANTADHECKMHSPRVQSALIHEGNLHSPITRESPENQDQRVGIAPKVQKTPMRPASPPRGREPSHDIDRFEITKERMERALAAGVPKDRIEFETALWRNYYKGRGMPIADLDAIWDGWMLRSGDRDKNKGHVRGGEDPTRAMIPKEGERKTTMLWGVDY